MRAAGLIRVSTLEQARGGVSLEMQEQRIAALASAEGMELARVYREEGVSGAARKRPILAELIADAEAGAWGVLVVWKLDRLSRNAATILRVLEGLRDKGIRFVSVTESFDTGAATGRLMLGIIALFAEFEREEIRERVAAAVQQMAAAGRWSGRPPFGYRSVEGVLVPHLVSDNGRPAEGLIIRDLFRWYVEDGLSPFQIAKRLNALTARNWRSTTVRHTLINPTYAGYVRNHETLYEGIHPPLVPRDLWERAQAVRSTRAGLCGRPASPGEQVRTRDRDSLYLLTGLIHCAKCGHRMYGHRFRKRPGRPGRVCRYVCRRETPSKCYASIGQKKAEGLLANYVTALAGATPAVLRSLPREPEERGARVDIEAELREIGRRRARLIDLLSRGVLSEADFKAATARAEDEGRHLREAVTAERGAAQATRQEPSEFADLGELLESGTVTTEAKRRALRAMFASLVIDARGLVHGILRREVD